MSLNVTFTDLLLFIVKRDTHFVLINLVTFTFKSLNWDIT